jgi:hypothetical protein
MGIGEIFVFAVQDEEGELFEKVLFLQERIDS